MKLWRQKEGLKTRAQLRRELKDKELSKIQKIKAIDALLIDLNFDVSIALKQIYIGLVADRDDNFMKGQTLLEFTVEN